MALKVILDDAHKTPSKGWPTRKNYAVSGGVYVHNGGSMALGGGGRFAALKSKLASQPGVTDPGALAASIGRKKYGAKKFNALSKGGK